ncbi:MAG: DegT/DnrJ/EryC1/StrS family aminotransferase [Archangium sp.]
MGDILLADFKAAWKHSQTALIEALQRVGESGWLVLGEEVAAFEKDLARAWGLPHAIGVANGLDALEICFRTLGAQPGDRFLTTPLSAFATTLAILRVGGIPEFVDVDASGLIDLALVRKRLADRTRPVRFFVPVHLFGHALPVDELEQISKEFGVELVEDCAQAIGAFSGKRPVGSASPMCATSFYPTKNLGALGDGGAVLCKSDEHAKHARRLRDYGQSDKYVHTTLGMNSRLDELQAAMLRSAQLPLLERQTARRTEIAEKYRAALREVKTLTLPPLPRDSRSVWHLFPVLVAQRDSFRAHLKAAGVHTGLHYPMLISSQQALSEAGHTLRPASDFPVADRFAREEVSLPLHPFLTDEDVLRVISACQTWRS